MMTSNTNQSGIQIELPGNRTVTLSHLLLDFTGTLSCDGVLLPGVADRLKTLGDKMHVTVLTADTFGTAARQVAGLPLDFHLIQTAQDKAEFIRSLGDIGIAAIGNGRNDIEMVRMATLGIAVMGPEGCAGELIAVAKVVCRDITDALDLLLNPLRIKATLRN